jgi:tRNA(Arg) A34 adenosine deaminase TadA
VVSSELHIRHLRRALQLALDNASSGHGGPFGAVIAVGEQIVAEGVNRVTDEVDPTAHAEVSAIREACRKLGRFSLDGCTIYSSCEPCPMCLSAIYWARLDALYFAADRHDAARAGFDDSLLYEQIPLEPGLRKLPTTRLLPGEGDAAFAAWLRSPGRVPY